MAGGGIDLSDGSTAVPLVDFPRTAGLPAIRVDHWTRRATAPVPGVPRPRLPRALLPRGGRPGPARRRPGRRALTTGDAVRRRSRRGRHPAHRAPSRHRETTGWMVFFPADAVDPSAAAPLWSPGAPTPCCPRSSANHRGGAQRLQIPPPSVRPGCAHLDRPRRRAARAGATATPTPRAPTSRCCSSTSAASTGTPRPRGGSSRCSRPCFDVIEARYHEPISLRDVAAAVGLTPGHLTTVDRAAHRPHRATVDHRAPDAGGPAPARRHRPRRRRDRTSRRVPRGGLLRPPVPRRARRAARGVAARRQAGREPA